MVQNRAPLREAVLSGRPLASTREDAGSKTASIFGIRSVTPCTRVYRDPWGSAPPLRRICWGAMEARNSAQRAGEPLFPVLTGRLKGMTPERVAWYQRARIQAALIDAVAQRSFTDSTVAELVESAAVSKTTFYEHFASKEDCFLQTYDDIITRVAERVSRACGGAGEPSERLRAALTAFVDVVVDEPAAGKLALIDVLSVGASGIARHEAGLETFEKLVGRVLLESPSAPPPPAETITAIAGGIRGIVYRKMRAGALDSLPDLVDLLAAWILNFQAPDSAIVARATEAAAQPRSEAAAGGSTQLDWNEPPDSPRSRRSLTQRERIVRGVAQLAISEGFESVTVRAISATSGTSNQTFYEHFANKREALIAAFELSAAEGVRSISAAFESMDRKPEAAGAAMRAMLEHVAGNHVFARLTFFELQTAGPLALDRADGVLDGVIEFLIPTVTPAELRAKVPRPILQAIGHGVSAVIQHELSRKPETLPELAPALTRFVLAAINSSPETSRAGP